MPFNKPLAKSLARPSPVNKPVKVSKIEFAALAALLASGSNVTLPIVEANCCALFPVWTNRAERV